MKPFRLTVGLFKNIQKHKDLFHNKGDDVPYCPLKKYSNFVSQNECNFRALASAKKQRFCVKRHLQCTWFIKNIIRKMRKSNVRVYFLQQYLNENSFNIYNFKAFSKQNNYLYSASKRTIMVMYNEKHNNIEGMRNPVYMDVHVFGQFYAKLKKT